ncbi:MAG: serine/threonine protein phosphatase [Alphaproteobacteria bacterium]|jgi:serine/threonine protein phosphatase 1|nr:serine/threonine protein phosphatase [Alphaproteobacteria bacterium]MBU2040774.1 serine/threonine protein phosphatase [Alphaproteobacteria bacterium]MBU2207884.1 serine/threonine protein phosphatase [Alphaproteobacteria bacterium]MBU2291247.1 serine/threonine protein phosphatase [Alphaproteobacteria bacterium]MBU2396681.1 serine/threonine protein phosphatase [Alphaproteobacteria bacterium]
MLSRLFRSRIRVAPQAEPAVPDGSVAWAVGDIHGRLDLLEPLVESIIADLEGSEATRRVVVFLGDYIDRGPDSRGVIRFLQSLPSVHRLEWRFLKGNHEQAMLDFLSDPAAGARWCEYGGDRALQSYGLRAPDLAHRTEAWARVAADLQHKLTKAEIAFLESLEYSVSLGGYFFSHAGARPGVALDRQSPQDLMWIRNTFLDSRIGFEQVVVHGHTPTHRVHADERRIGIDTKAYDTGVLTALRLEGRQRKLLQAVGARRGQKGTGRDGDERCDGGAVVLRAESLEGQSVEVETMR